MQCVHCKTTGQTVPVTNLIQTEGQVLPATQCCKTCSSNPSRNDLLAHFQLLALTQVHVRLSGRDWTSYSHTHPCTQRPEAAAAAALEVSAAAAVAMAAAAAAADSLFL